MTTDKNLVEALAIAAEMLCKEACSTAADGLERMAESLDHLRSRLADIAVTPDDEEAKRFMISLWDEQSENWRRAADIVRCGTIEPTTLANELKDALFVNSGTIVRKTPDGEHVRIDDFREHLIERANNIAAAYRGRVAREPK